MQLMCVTCFSVTVEVKDCCIAEQWNYTACDFLATFPTWMEIQSLTEKLYRACGHIVIFHHIELIRSGNWIRRCYVTTKKERIVSCLLPAVPMSDFGILHTCVSTWLEN